MGRPGGGDRVSVGDRRNNLQNRFANVDRNNIGNRIGNNVNIGQINVDARRQWGAVHGRHYAHHGRWYHGGWGGGYWGAPGARWNYWWSNYPVFSAFRVTTWAVNRVGWAFGYNSYSNPYYSSTTVVDNSVYDYSQPIVMYPDETTLSADPETAGASAGVPDAAMTDFQRAQQEFYGGDYAKALTSTDAALKEMPNDAVVHEFRALVLFALERYDEAAATLYPVLSVGPGWDWTTMSSLYPQADVYTAQLRKLEEATKAKPDSAALHFVLGYHYVTCGHEDAAKAEFAKVVELNPKDTLAADLLLGIDPEAKIPTQPEITKPPENVAKPDPKALVGTWAARRSSGETFEMTLGDDGTFTWKYSAGGRSQTVRGVYALDADGVLALEMNDDGVMLAKIDLKGTSMTFYMLGDVQGTEPLKFERR